MNDKTMELTKPSPSSATHATDPELHRHPLGLVPVKRPFQSVAHLVRISRQQDKKSLTDEQKEQVEHWLFVEKIPRAVARRRCKELFDVDMGDAAMTNFHNKLEHEQNRLDIEERRRMADEMRKSASALFRKYCPEGFVFDYQAAAQYVAQAAFDISRRAKDGRVTTQLRHLMKIAGTAREQSLAENKFMLEVAKMEVDIAELCLKHLSQLKSIETSRVPYEQKIRLIRLKLFGSAPE